MQGGTKARAGAYEAVREDAGLKFQRSRRPLSTDQGRYPNWVTLASRVCFLTSRFGKAKG